MILGINGIIAGRGLASIDADAQAFITAAGITDSTQKSAINQLVLDLKSANIWTKMKAIYPFVGGTATTHKFNLKDPRDLDVAYRLVFNGGWTHSATGALPNGTNGYADTKLNPTSALTSLSHLSYYSRTDSTRSELNGGQDDQTSTSAQMYILGNKTTDVFSLSSNDAQRVTSSSTSTLGLYLVSRTSSTSLKGYKNASNVGTNISSSTGAKPNINMYIGAFNYKNSGGAFTIYYGNKECAFSSIGDGLSDAEATAFYNAVQTFNTTLGRQV